MRIDVSSKNQSGGVTAGQIIHNDPKPEAPSPWWKDARAQFFIAIGVVFSSVVGGLVLHYFGVSP